MIAQPGRKNARKTRADVVFIPLPSSMPAGSRLVTPYTGGIRCKDFDHNQEESAIRYRCRLDCINVASEALPYQTLLPYLNLTDEWVHAGAGSGI
jgi:hypothetical protein